MPGLRAATNILWTRLKGVAKRTLRRTPGLKRLVAMWDRMAVLEQSMAVLRSSLQAKIMAVEGRLDESARPAAKRPLPGMTAAGLEFLLAHSRLPAPPSRILDLAGILQNGGIDLGSLGYQIEHQPAGDGQWATVICRLGDVPSRPASEQAVSEALHLLQSGGRLIVSMPLAANAAVPRWLTQLPVREVVRARRDGNRWTFASSPGESSEPSLLLSVVEKA